MQKTFLQHVVSSVYEFNQEKTLVVFPTRRACIAFRNELAIHYLKVAWLPVIIPVRDLLIELSDLPVAGENTLLMELYKVYTNLFPDETLEGFLSWGQQLIDDFNEIDRQMVPADQLFQKVYDVKTIENIFALEEEDFSYFKEFWSQFSTENITPLRNEFLNYWKMLPDLYTSFKQHLQDSGFAYEGMTWKLAAENIQTNTYFHEYDQVVFAGFYAFTKSEEKIIKFLQQNGKAVLYKDADSWYIEAKFREAGRFFRKGILNDPQILWTGNDLTSSVKDITVTGIGGRSAMARELAIKVHNELKDQPENILNRSVVVLPDDGLLFPFLDHCSRLGISVNPSMGFPLRHHPLLQLLHTIKSLRKQLIENPGEWFIADQASWMIDHPLLIAVLSKEDKSQLKELSENNLLTGKISAVVKLLITNPDSPEQEEKLVSNFLLSLHTLSLSVIEGLRNAVQKESKIIWKQLKPYYSELNINAWWKLYMNLLDKIRIPFRAEADKSGVQVMGFLETRILDYEYVFIASLNEGTLPNNSTPKSLIPYSLRKAYQLPCREEQDAVTAYHFYRLLQRAEHIHFFYNSDMNDMGGGEKSRFLYQLQHELKESNPAINFNFVQIENTPPGVYNKNITIQKTEAILNILKNNFVEGIAIKEFAGLSASAINSYVSCSFKFYLEQIAGLKEDEIHNTIDPAVFGNILHHAMQTIYSDKKVITEEIIESELKKIKSTVDDSIKIKFKKTTLSGNDFLMEGVLNDLIKRILKTDYLDSPFSIEGLELKVQQTLSIPGSGNVFIKGIIDRIDSKENFIRILDYKTGNDELKLPENLSELFTDPVYKTTMQLLFYVNLIKNKYGLNNIKAGLIRLRNIKEGINFLTGDLPIDVSLINEFSIQLNKIIAEIFDSSKTFQQTSEYERCKFCQFNKVCNRAD